MDQALRQSLIDLFDFEDEDLAESLIEKYGRRYKVGTFENTAEFGLDSDTQKQIRTILNKMLGSKNVDIQKEAIAALDANANKVGSVMIRRTGMLFAKIRDIQLEILAKAGYLDNQGKIIKEYKDEAAKLLGQISDIGNLQTRSYSEWMNLQPILNCQI